VARVAGQPESQLIIGHRERGSDGNRDSPFGRLERPRDRNCIHGFSRPA
jgi:hypothetical protein